ncbi:hypothetical protein HY635_00400 [Candidatus Uhrbacteria bacterium]|nr:hypothetical protein [Candidatus Uhrbacteria bacterium]
MSPNRAPLTITVAATVVAWLAWVFIIARTDPATAGTFGFVLFYLTLFAAVGGSAMIVGLFIRRHVDDAPRSIRIAIRQGALTGLAIAVAVFLQTRDLLTWWNLLFLIAALTLLELFMISLRRTKEPLTENLD